MLLSIQVTIAVIEGWITVYSARGEARVTRADRYAANGIVHTVDAVL